MRAEARHRSLLCVVRCARQSSNHLRICDTNNQLLRQQVSLLQRPSVMHAFAARRGTQVSMRRPCDTLLRLILKSSACHAAGAEAGSLLCTQTGAVRSREMEQWNIRDALADSAELTTTEQCVSVLAYN